ncbi:MAG: hypothetical protein VZR31_08905 [Lachnospiraceae bacterium]|jgi:hypothetical protein|nr:hypothetical protein [Lachnospiraceae bacterium]MDY5704348.1 hypothetical protein [Lachnospiraceae bacterium]MEE3358191.1 hypothetical protein [Lachnospiraceae bacterium]
MREIVEEYGGLILGCIGAGLIIALFLGVLIGPFTGLISQWTMRYL